MMSLRKIQGKIAQKIYEAPLGNSLIYSYHIARSALYHVESLPVIHMDLLIREGKLKLPEEQALDIKVLADEVQNLYKKDVESMEAGYFKAESILFENPIEHIKNLNKVFLDGLKLSFRKKNNETKFFTEETKNTEEFKNLPDYYKRNFHFQTNGYLSRDSAEIYNHQVEILFKGTSDAMRRMMMAPIVKHFNLQKTKPVRFFEAGCGNGVSTYPMAKRFKRVQITASDLSKDYISYAREYNTDLKNVQWVKSDCTHLENIEDGLFDAWYSVFMFHELPREERVKALKEAYRILKPGGIITIVDSIQKKDKPDLDFLLDHFPQNFHEPFYKNYTMHPLEDLLSEVGFEKIEKDTGFASKVVSGIKPIS